MTLGHALVNPLGFGFDLFVARICARERIHYTDLVVVCVCVPCPFVLTIWPALCNHNNVDVVLAHQHTTPHHN